MTNVTVIAAPARPARAETTDRAIYFKGGTVSARKPYGLSPEFRGAL
jgi:hypothetical protein